jgi:hypothetical protein
MTVKLTTIGSHKATQRGYAAGRIIEEEMEVPDGIPVSSRWMKPVKGQRDPLDHDDDGNKGGSPKGEQSTATKGRLRKAAAKAEE